MFQLITVTMWPYVLGVLLGIAWAWLASRRQRARTQPDVPVAAPSGVTRTLAIIAFAAAILLTLLLKLFSTLAPFAASNSAVFDAFTRLTHERIATPILVATFAVILMLFPFWPGNSRRPRNGGLADSATAANSLTVNSGVQVSRRTILTFVSGRALAATLLVLATLLVTVVAAGIASTPDESGAYRMYEISNGDLIVSVTIYGWYFSVPMLVLLGVLLSLCVLGLFRIAGPPLGGSRSDAASDAAERRGRALCLIAAVCGGVLLQLGTVWLSLSGTAAVEGGALFGEQWLGAWSTFAALATPLRVLGLLAVASGIAVWVRALCGLLVPTRRTRVAA